jgi:hypothetical protein
LIFLKIKFSHHFLYRKRLKVADNVGFLGYQSSLGTGNSPCMQDANRTRLIISAETRCMSPKAIKSHCRQLNPSMKGPKKSLLDTKEN